MGWKKSGESGNLKMMDKGQEGPRVHSEVHIFENFHEYFSKVLYPEKFASPDDKAVIQRLNEELDQRARIFIAENIADHAIPYNKVLILPVDSEEGFPFLAILFNKKTAADILKNRNLFIPSNRQILLFAKEILKLNDMIPPDDRPSDSEYHNQSSQSIKPAHLVFRNINGKYNPPIPELLIEKQSPIISMN